MVKLEANFTPLQDLNGQEAPWPPGGGKNKWPEYETQTLNDVTLTNDHGKVTINGTASADTYFDLTVNYSATQGTNMYLYAFNPSASSSNRLTMFIISTDGNPQINLDSADKYSAVPASVDLTISKLRLRVPNGVQYTNFVLYPYLQIGGTAPTSFAPYSNECPISGHTGAEVVRTGKNLLAKPFKIKSTSSTISDAFYIKAGTYHLSFSVANATSWRLGVRTFNADGSYASDSGYKPTVNGFAGLSWNITHHCWLEGQNETNNSGTITFPKDCYITFVVSVGDTTSSTTVSNAMFSLGSTAETYEPFSGTTVAISFGQTVYGGQLTVFEDGSGQIVATKAYVALNDSTKWQTYSGNYDFLYTEHLSNKKNYSTSFEGLICSCLPVDSTAESYMKWTSASGDRVGIKSSVLTLQQVQTMATNGDIAIVYDLATPVTIPLTPGQIQTLVGTNTVWVNNAAGDITVQAYGTEIS